MRKTMQRSDDGNGSLEFMVGRKGKLTWWYVLRATPLFTWIRIETRNGLGEQNSGTVKWERGVLEPPLIARILDACRYEVDRRELVDLFAACKCPMKIQSVEFDS